MSNQLTVYEQPTQLVHALQSYRQESCNLLLPTTDLRFIAPDHKIVINTVKLDPDADFWEVDVSWERKNNQWQKHVTGYALSKRGLRRLMQIAGITVTASHVNWDNEGRAHAQATIRMLGTDGIPRQFIGTYTWDTPARIEEAEQRLKEKLARDPQNEDKHRKAFEADRFRIIKFATSLAETGALNRALRDALTVKNKYTPDEIKKPFVCLQVIEPKQPDIDFNHPFIRQLISTAMLNNIQLPTTPATTTTDSTEPYIDPTSDAVAAGEVSPPPTESYKPLPARPAIIEDIAPPTDNTHDPRTWQDRPLDPEELRARINANPGEDIPPDNSLFRKYHAAMKAVTHGNTQKRHLLQQYLFGASSSKELTAWQMGRLYLWAGISKDPETGQWVPSPHAINELQAILETYQEALPFEEDRCTA